MRTQIADDSLSRVGTTHREASRWAIVLAGGEGKRMRPFVQSFLGKDLPKQYCAFTGSRSMMQQSLDRAGSLVPRDNVVASIGAGQRGFFDDSLSYPFHGTVFEQPADRGTLGAILASAAWVASQDPEATLLIMPSDSYLRPEEGFLTIASLAILYAERLAERLVLLGAVADSPETDYGWIEPTLSLYTGSGRLRLAPAPVKSFHEKPDQAQAESLFHSGCFWNTMIGAVKVKALWRMGWKVAPEAMEAFEWFRTRGVIGPNGPLSDRVRERNLAAVFAKAARADFSTDLLQQCPEDISVLAMRGVEWSDWGRPERVRAALEACACF